MDRILSVQLLALVLLGAGFLIPFAVWYYARRRFEAAEVAATITFWATLPLLVVEAAALAISTKTYGAPLLEAWRGPTPELVGMAYPPFAVMAAWLLRRAARGSREEEERRRARELSGIPDEARRGPRGEDPEPPPGP